VVQRCNGSHIGPFSLGIDKAGQYRCEHCGVVLSGVEVYIDATEHADAAKADKREPVKSACP
jgi:hypothetical protein